MKLHGEVTEEGWRATDRRRAYLIYAVAAVAAAVVTLLLYSF